MEQTEILHCPFCNGFGIVAGVVRDGYENEPEDDPDRMAYYVHCHACAAQGGWAKSTSGAVRLWNMRVGAQTGAFVELSASEALYGFAAWLTTRREPVTAGANHEASIWAELVAEFCDANNLTEPREEWTNWLVHPSELATGE